MKKIASDINYKKASRLGGIVRGAKGFKEKEWSSYADGIIAIARECVEESKTPGSCIKAKFNIQDPRKTPGSPPVLKVSESKKILLQQRLAGVFSRGIGASPDTAQSLAAGAVSYLFEKHNIETT